MNTMHTFSWEITKSRNNSIEMTAIIREILVQSGTQLVESSLQPAELSLHPAEWFVYIYNPN